MMLYSTTTTTKYLLIQANRPITWKFTSNLQKKKQIATDAPSEFESPFCVQMHNRYT